MRLCLTWPSHVGDLGEETARADAKEGRDYDPDQVSWLWRITGEADVRICENNQKGVNSRWYEPGRYSLTEQHVDKFIQRYLHQLQQGVCYDEK